MCLKSILMFYTNVLAVSLFSSNWPVDLKKIGSKMKPFLLYMHQFCVNDSPTVLLKKHFTRAHLLSSIPECIWSKNFHIFWKKYWNFVLPIPGTFLFLHVHMLQDKPDCALCMHDICFFNRKWHMCITIIFHHFWGFLFVNCCHLSCCL